MYFGSRLAMGMGRDVRGDLFHRVVAFSQREVGQFGPPSLITRNTNDVQQVQMLVQVSATLMISAPMLAIGGVIMAVRQDAGLSWLMAVAIPILLIIVGLIVVRMVPAFTQMQKKIDRVNQIMREQLTGIRVIRAFVREREEHARFETASEDVMATGLRAGNLMALMFPAVMLVMNVSSVAVIWFGAFQVQENGVEIGTLFAFLNYLMQILMGVMMATFMFVMIPRAAVCANRIGEVLDTDPSVAAPADPTAAPAAIGRIEFEHVDFAYPGAEEAVLHDLTFTVEPGTTTAIIGSTGSGKTTLVGLVARLFDVTAGAVRIDGVDVRSYEPDLLWRRIGLIPQRAFLFSGTVASNLRYGDDQATDEELWRALELAQAKEFVAVDGGRARSAHRAGWHERVGRPAPATRDRPGTREAAGDLRLRRLVLGTGSADGCRAPPRPRHAPAGCDAHRRRAAGHHHPARRPDHRPRPRPHGRRRDARRAPRVE